MLRIGSRLEGSSVAPENASVHRRIPNRRGMLCIGSRLEGSGVAPEDASVHH